MKYVTETKHVPLGFGEIAGGALDEQAVTLKGAVHSLRAMGGITFLALRVRDGAVQCVCRPEELPEGLCEECAAVVTGTVRREERAPGGRELAAEEVRVLSRPAAPMPVAVSKRRLRLNLDTELSLRPLVLRSLRTRSVFKVQEGISRAFREYLTA